MTKIRKAQMKPERIFFAIFISVISLFGLGACQTSAPVPTSPNSTSTPAPPTVEREKPKSVETKLPDSVSRGSVTPEFTRQIANNCFTCHGPAGKSPGTIPSLTHLSATELSKSMKNFRSGSTVSTVMGRHAKAYTDSEIDAVANYIAGLKR
jgi:sulfide dehydrogenase cytochrome subunit